jgi:hypothetical protein
MRGTAVALAAITDHAASGLDQGPPAVRHHRPSRDSTRALMTRYLNKELALGSETNTYNVAAVTDGGFALARVHIEASGQAHNQKVTRFIP